VEEDVDADLKDANAPKDVTNKTNNNKLSADAEEEEEIRSLL